MTVGINAVSTKLGGALTYLQNVLPLLADELAARQPTERLLVWRGTSEGSWPACADYVDQVGDERGTQRIATAVTRLWFDQVTLRAEAERRDLSALFSPANVGTLYPPCRQVLLLRNTIYFEPMVLDVMSPRVRAQYFLQKQLALRSIAASEVVMFPSKAMADLVAQHTNASHANWLVAHYGTRHDWFYPSEGQHANPMREPTRILNVSLYCDQKNLFTLFKAIDILEQRKPKSLRLDVTANLDPRLYQRNAFAPNFARDMEAFQVLAAKGAARDLGKVPYRSLPDLYRSADIFVFPSYTESFGHPLVEAMACGLPIVAADTPVHRELCKDAAVYFSTFSAEDCARAIDSVRTDEALRSALSRRALAVARQFRWDDHVRKVANALVPSTQTHDAAFSPGEAVIS